MTVTAERITLDPDEVSTGRTEFDITPWIDHEGIDWGDAQIAAFMSETDVGEVPVDFRMPNRQITIPLAFVNRGTITAQVARARLQAKLALFQREGGWVKRVTNSGGTVYADVVDGAFHATSAPGYASNRDEDYEASATLSLIPEFYGNEITLGDHSTTTAAELVFTETTVRGDVPGRVRLVVDNDEAQVQQSLIWGFRARNYDAADAATTARIAWDAEAFNSITAGTAGAFAGAVGGTLVSYIAPTSFTTMVGNTTFTHQGHYRVLARARCATSDTATIRWRWSVDGGATFVENDPVDVEGAVFRIIDLGQVDVRKPPTGSHNWRGYVQAQSVGGKIIRIDRVWFVPADEFSGEIRTNAMLSAQAGNELRTEGYFAKSGSNYFERPIYGDLPRLPVPKQTGGTVECLVKASRSILPGADDIAAGDAGIDDLSARITYRPSWLFVDDT
jgi:hypothetical protein